MPRSPSRGLPRRCVRRCPGHRGPRRRARPRRRQQGRRGTTGPPRERQFVDRRSRRRRRGRRRQLGQSRARRHLHRSATPLDAAACQTLEIGRQQLSVGGVASPSRHTVAIADQRGRLDDEGVLLRIAEPRPPAGDRLGVAVGGGGGTATGTLDFGNSPRRSSPMLATMQLTSGHHSDRKDVTMAQTAAPTSGCSPSLPTSDHQLVRCCGQALAEGVQASRVVPPPSREHLPLPGSDLDAVTRPGRHRIDSAEPPGEGFWRSNFSANARSSSATSGGSSISKSTGSPAR